MDKQDWYFGQIVSADEMDTLYSDMANAEENLALEAQLSQTDVIADIPKYGGIMKGFIATKTSGNPKSLDISPGSGRDGLGRRISTLGKTASSVTPVTLSLANLGATPEGTVVTATGDGALTAAAISAGEAWTSVFAVYDTHLSDTRVDSLGNTISFRQEDSFHFEIEVGTDLALGTATSRPNLAINKVLICDVLLDNNGDIRVISTFDAIAASSKDLNKIAYGLDDTPNLAGRRSDWCSVDADGTSFDLLKDAYDNTQPHNKAYYSIRAGTPREAIRTFLEIMTEPGSVNKAGGSEILGARPITGKVLSSPGSAVALQMPAGSIHTQLEALYDKVNTLLSRGSDTLTGNLTVTGNVIVQTGVTVTGNYLSAAGNITLTAGDLILTSGDGTIGGTFAVTGLSTLQALDVQGLARFGSASPKNHILATSEQQWGVDGTYTTGRSRMLTNGRLVMGDGFEMLPIDNTVTTAALNPKNLAKPTDRLLTTYGKFDAGVGVADSLITTQSGRLARGNHVLHNFAQYSAPITGENGADLLEGPDSELRSKFLSLLQKLDLDSGVGATDYESILTPDPGKGFHHFKGAVSGSGSGTIRKTNIGNQHLRMATGGIIFDDVSLLMGGPFRSDGTDTVWFYARIQVLSISDIIVFAGLMNNANTFPEAPGTSSAGFAGFLFNTTVSPNWFFRTGDGSSSPSVDTGIVASIGGYVDLYFTRHGVATDTFTYWMTGMASPATITPAINCSNLWSPYIYLQTLTGGLKSIHVQLVEAYDDDIKGI